MRADVLCPGADDIGSGAVEHPPVILRMATSYPLVPECDPKASTALRHYEEVIRAEGVLHGPPFAPHTTPAHLRAAYLHVMRINVRVLKPAPHDAALAADTKVTTATAQHRKPLLLLRCRQEVDHVRGQQDHPSHNSP